MQGIVFVAVHIGAGFHSPARQDNYKKLIAAACLKGFHVKSGKAIDAVVQAITLLEDHPLTNAGIGSNIARNGTISCDASIMSGKDGSYGAFHGSGYRNPIQQACSILLQERIRSDPKSGLVMPMMLAMSQNEPPDDLVTQEQWEKYKKYMDLLDSTCSPLDTLNQSTNESDCLDKQDLFQDTVGAVAIDASGEIVAGVSSGGIWLKQSGRIGEAAHYGSGIWAETGANERMVGISTTGTGEQIMKGLLASRLGSLLSQRDLEESEIPREIIGFVECNFLENPWMKGYLEIAIGFILVLQDPSDPNHVTFAFAHTTASMGFGYLAHGSNDPTVKISRKDPLQKMTIGVESIKLRARKQQEQQEKHGQNMQNKIKQISK